MARISLCMIVGNESAHILRCLAAFRGGFDELSLVRACGASTPDDTEQQAREWCEANGKAFVFGEYKNEASAADWPHVDSFAAARNASFAQATGDWLFWADADDIMRENTPAEGLRDAAAEAEARGADCVHFPYDVPGTNKAPLRERMISRRLWDAGRRWAYAVHENLVCRPEDKRLICDAPVWQHAPLAVKPRSHDRNLRLLGHSLRDTASQLFYVHQEHYYARSQAKAREFGTLALGMPNLHDSFRLEILMNLGRIAPTQKEAREWFGRAFAEMPFLREPLAALTLTYLESGDHARALDCVLRMESTPEPVPERRPWAYEAKWYGWAGVELGERIRRLNGQPVAPRPVKIALLHATRGRAQQAWECRERWLNTATDPNAIEYVMAVDSDDKASVELARQFAHVIVEPGSCVRAWNAAANASKADVLVQLSDDWHPSLGWDTAILRELGDTSKPSVLAVGDGHRTDSLLCMAILTRARWEAQGREMFSPEYQSVFSDNEFSHRAWRDGVVIDARERLSFTHAHPFFDKEAKWDSTYEAQNAKARYEDGRATFLRRNPDAHLAA